MNQNYTSNNNSSVSKITAFARLKEQQYALNMQIRLAMQIHDAKGQKELELEMAKLMERMHQVSV